MTPLGQTSLDHVSLMLSTGMHNFVSPHGIEGLAHDQITRLSLLAVYANKPGTGQFRSFIAACKTHWPSIVIWHVDNPDLRMALLRYGFIPHRETDWNGDELNGFQWKRL